MSERPIEPGDLVRVIGGHACILKAAGCRIFQVREIFVHGYHSWQCSTCWRIDIAPKNQLAARLNTKACCPVEWLKRIDPGSVDQSMPTHEELTA